MVQLAFPVEASTLEHREQLEVAAVLQAVHAVLSEARAYPALHSAHCTVLPEAEQDTQLDGHLTQALALSRA